MLHQYEFIDNKKEEIKAREEQEPPGNYQ